MYSTSVALFLSKIRSTLEILRKEWNGQSSESYRVIVEKLRANQHDLRHNGSSGLVDPLKIIEPFLQLLKSDKLLGPYKLVSLDAIQTFISHDVLLEEGGSSQTEFVLSEIIDALVNCKFNSAGGGDSHASWDQYQQQQQQQQYDQGYIQQGGESEALMQLQILQNIESIVRSSTKLYLRDETAWSLVKFVHELLIQAAVSGHSALYQSASHVMEGLLSLIFRQRKLLEDNGMLRGLEGGSSSSSGSSGSSGISLPSSSSSDANDTTGDAPIATAAAVAAHAGMMESDPVFLNGKLSTISALKALTFFTGVIERHAYAEDGDVCSDGGDSGGGGGSGSSGGGGRGKAGSRRGYGNKNSNSNGNGSSDGTNRGHNSNADGAGGESSREVVELILALKAVHTIILIDGSRRLIRARGGLLLLTPVFSHYIRDDIGKCLVMLAGKQHFPLAVTEVILDLFTALVSAYGPVIRVVVENFLRHVYLRALFQSLRLFQEQDVFLDSNSGNGGGLSDHLGGEEGGGRGRGGDGKYGDAQSASSAAAGASRDSSAMSPTSNDFKKGGAIGLYGVPRLELVLESLVDLLADRDFLPSVFASFDCDTTKNNVVQPMVRYLSRCVRYTFCNTRQGSMNGGVSQGPLAEISNICVACYSALLTSLTDRCALRESSKDDISSSQRVELVSQIYRAARTRKAVMARAAHIFSTAKKPSDAFRFLQEHGILKSPAPTKDIAEFLRYTPGLDIEKVGSYLGELGKSDAAVAMECDGVAFHEAVLEDFLALFDFRDLPVLEAIRIFLSTFLLPSEAQQIDRIFIALAEHCHRSCVECVSGAFENSDVTYLMTMSIIMLNTDRHNPNIKPERKMTIEKFVKVNTNYGRDVKQTKAIDRDYLEGIYNEIGVRPLRTEPDDLSSGITREMWKEKQLQLKRRPERGLMAGLSSDAESLRAMSTLLRMSVDTFEETLDALVAAADKGFISPHATAHALNPLALGACIVDHSWLFDADYVSCVWPEMLGVGICPFLLPRMPPHIPDRLQPEVWYRRESTPQSLRAGIDVLMTLLKAADTYSVRHVTDVVVALLVEVVGATRFTVGDAMFAKLNLGFNLAHHTHDGTAASRNASRSKLSDASNQITSFTRQLLNSLEGRAALITLLQIVQSSAGYVKDKWGMVWHVLGKLRDSALLPAEMVCMANGDVLPTIVRSDFEARLANFELAAQRKNNATQMPKRKTGLLGFLFGSGMHSKGNNGDKTSDKTSETSADVEDEEEVTGADPALALVTRWDAGYSDYESGVPMPSSSSSFPLSSTPQKEEAGTTMLARDQYAPELSSGEADDGDALHNLRGLILSCGTDSLVADSKFFPDDTLVGFVKALAAHSTAFDEDVMPPLPPGANANSTVTATSSDGGDRNRGRSGSATSVGSTGGGSSTTTTTDTGLGAILGGAVPPPSAATAAWLENVLVDIALRNRDRFVLLWPLLRDHYTRGLSSKKKLSYVVERRVVGVLKIVEQMLSRTAHAKALLSLLAALFVLPESAAFRGSVQPMADPLSPSLLRDVAGQISTGLWRAVTRNVESLPRLGMEQWQVMFDILAFCSGSGGFACIKAFETLAWLLHEPRLRAEVPVFCVVGIRPLLSARGVPGIVSVGAVKLLMHLHARLQVLVKDSPDADADEDAKSTGNSKKHALWESCWVPILHALAEGTQDSRAQVSAASALAISSAMQDRHASVVPSSVLADILGNVIVPCGMLLGQALVRTAANRTLDDNNNNNRGGDDVTRLSRDEEILYEVLRSGGGSARPSFDDTSTTAASPDNTDSRTVRAGSSDAAAAAPVTGGHRSPLRQALLPPQGENYNSGSDASNQCNVAALSLPPAVVVVQCICDAFLRHLEKLTRFPDFQKLWCERILPFLGFYLEAPDAFKHSELLGSSGGDGEAEEGSSKGDSFPPPSSPHLSEAVHTARSALLSMLRAMVSGGHFKGHGLLWKATQDVVGTFAAFEEDMKVVLAEAVTQAR